MNIESFNNLYKCMMDNYSLYGGIYTDVFTFKCMNVDIDRESRRKPLPLGMGSRRGK